MNKIGAKAVLLISTGLSLFSSTSCSKKVLYHDLTRLTDYMHMVTFTDYKEDVNHETVVDPTQSFKDEAACSVIRNGNFFARNLDYYYCYIPVFLTKVNANKTKGRFASLGLCYHSWISEDEIVVVENNKNSHFHPLEIVPNKTVDGINENGVVCCLNDCPLDDLSTPISGTNPGKPRLYATFLCRFVLDHATSAKHAIELLENMDIYLTDDNARNLHYMIADKDETYIVELFNNQLKVAKKEDDKRIMTNFYNNLTESEINATYEEGYQGPKDYSNNAHGVERYQHLKEKYSTSNDVDSIRETLKEVRYSQIYVSETGEMPSTPINPSEDYTQTQIHNNEFPNWETIYTSTHMVLDNHRRDLGREKDVWITEHSSIYDIENKKLHLLVQENYSREYEVSFDNFLVKQVDLI